MVLHLNAGRHAPALLGTQAEHVPEAVHNQRLVFLTGITDTYNTLADHIPSPVNMYTLVAGYPALQVNVVHRNLTQREVTVVPVDVRHLLVHVRRPATQTMLNKHLVVRLVHDVVDGTLAQRQGLAVLVNKLVGVIELACSVAEHVQLAGDKHKVLLPHALVVWLVLLYRNAQHKPLHLDAHAPCALVTELAADKAGITVALVLVHLFPETKRTLRQRVAILVLQRCNGRGHHPPVVLAFG